MTAPDQTKITKLRVPAQPGRRRSRLGEATVRIELVVIDGNGQLGRELFRRQATVVREALQWFVDHPPTDGPDRYDAADTEAT